MLRRLWPYRTLFLVGTSARYRQRCSFNNQPTQPLSARPDASTHHFTRCWHPQASIRVLNVTLRTIRRRDCLRFICARLQLGYSISWATHLIIEAKEARGFKRSRKRAVSVPPTCHPCKQIQSAHCLIPSYRPPLNRCYLVYK